MTVLAPEAPINAGDDQTAPQHGFPRPEPHGAQGRRRDIQGLRALAVAAVVGDHLAGTPSGGFVGVDIFFVISGFLITGLLLREYGRTGRIDLLGFYKRRIKRTLPVAWVVLLATIAAGAAVLSSYGFSQLVPASVAAGSFWSNWQLVGVGTDYLHATDAPVAVQHYWSLAVEEQFYLVWPAVLVIALVLARRKRLRRVPPVMLAVLAIGSLGWAALETTAHPTAAYFATFTRGWELLAGAGIAFATPLVSRLPSKTRPFMAWVGFALLIWTIFALSPESKFPFPWAMSAVLGTSLVIAAGAEAGRARLWPLTNRAAQYIGAISYSVYLWHFPVITFTDVFHPGEGDRGYALKVLLTLALSVLSYHLIEVPFRRASWRRPRVPRIRPRALVRTFIGVALVVILASTVVLTKQSAPARAVATTGYFPTNPTALQSVRSDRIAVASAAAEWPAITPAPGDLGEGARVDEWLEEGCLLGYGLPMSTRHCVFGDRSAVRTAVVYGDSIALSYSPAVRSALADDGWRIETLTRMQCPAIDISVTKNDGAPNGACDAFHRSAMRRIAREHPALVLIASSHLSLNRLASGAKGAAAAAEWSARTRSTVSRLADVAGHVMVLDGPSVGLPTQSCKTPSSTPQDCVSSVSPDWKQAADAQRSGVRRAGHANVVYPSTLPWFCTHDGRCPSFISGVVTLADGEHLTEEASQELGPLLREAIMAVVDPSEPT